MHAFSNSCSVAFMFNLPCLGCFVSEFLRHITRRSVEICALELRYWLFCNQNMKQQTLFIKKFLKNPDLTRTKLRVSASYFTKYRGWAVKMKEGQFLINGIWKESFGSVHFYFEKESLWAYYQSCHFHLLGGVKFNSQILNDIRGQEISHLKDHRFILSPLSTIWNLMQRISKKDVLKYITS